MGFANQIKVTAKLLNCRLQPSMSAQILGTIKMGEVHNVVAEQNGWGQLENGSWINLIFTVPHEQKETAETPTAFVTGLSTKEEQPEESKKAVTSVNEAEAETETGQDKPILHKVKKRESLWDIAELYYGKGNGDRYVEIKKFNNLKSDILRSTMVLKIPNV